MQESERPLRLVTGQSIGLRLAEALIWLSCLLTLLNAELSPLFTVLSITILAGVLIITHLANSRSSGILQLSVGSDGHGYLQHESDGRIPISLTRSSWCTHWICVVQARLTDSGKIQHLVICRSRQHPDDYRRLLQWMRLRLVSTEYQA